jgi:ABC-type proline/glycine betaine transport system permease subunit
METKITRKGAVQGLEKTIIALGIVGMVLAVIVFSVLTFNSSLNSSAAWDVLSPIVDVFSDIPTYVGLIITLSLLGVVIAIVAGFAMSRMRR